MRYLLLTKIFTLLLVILFATGCASTHNPDDPLESMNRSVFEVNEMLDEHLMEPVARGYKYIVPDPIEMVVGNFFSNINDVVVTANSLLQLNFESAVASGARVLINTTFGMLGLIDIASDVSMASDINLDKRNEDFGQTLGRYGIGSGPYLVLPFFGPSSVRDAVGLGVDVFIADPISTVIYLNNVNALDTVVRSSVGTGRLLDTRAQLLDVQKTLEEAALDKYEFIRDAYLQRRESLVNNYDTSEPDELD
ncbi:MAG: VacJ family lipoprotein [Nitrosomonas sp.]|nr:VacJ family lipoprotein [Nitrosomonas sp.]